MHWTRQCEVNAPQSRSLKSETGAARRGESDLNQRFVSRSSVRVYICGEDEDDDLSREGSYGLVGCSRCKSCSPQLAQMPGVSYVQPESRYSTSTWYTNVDVALMGIQSTAQFVDKYHHIIGKSFTERRNFCLVGRSAKDAAAASTLTDRMMSVRTVNQLMVHVLLAGT